ncbi:MAG: hypothetical protein RLZZ385_2748 [Pseudomonadota bacterium]|jgi:hypothetical protein
MVRFNVPDWRFILQLLALLLAVLVGPVSADDFAPRQLPVTVVREYREVEQQATYEQLLDSYGSNKSLPPGYELQTLLALSHYPELRDIRIQFILADVGIPLASRPWWASMLNSARQRTYRVIIDTVRPEGRDALLLGQQPFNAQVGIIGHELAHTVYYLDRSFLGIAGDALCQLSSCRIEFERATDRRLVDYGLGWQRYDHSVFLRRELGRPDTGLETAGGAYLGPAELLSLMQENPAYSQSLASQP